MLVATSKSTLSALLAGSPAAAAAAELFVTLPAAEWPASIVPAALLLVIATSLATIGYLVTREVAKRVSRSSVQNR